MTTQNKPKVIIFDIGGVCLSLPHHNGVKYPIPARVDAQEADGLNFSLRKIQVVSPFRAILDYESANSIPRGYINYAISASKPNGSWHKLEKGQVLLNAAFFAAFRRDILNPETWRRYHETVRKTVEVPPLPATLDTEKLYWTMMSTARATDPYMGPALHRLKESGQFHLVALSNTSIFPPGHEFNEVGPDDVRNVFEIFVSSAHVGMRKPEKDIYEYTMGLVRERWANEDITAADVVFLDDIGENLKMGREMGWRTVKVGLEKTRDAVNELEKITGLDLLDNESKTRSAKL